MPAARCRLRINSVYTFIYVFLLQQSTEKLVASRIQTQIIGVEGEDADHYTTPTALSGIN